MRKTTLLTTLAATVIAVAVMVGAAAAAGGADLTINKQQNLRNPVHVGAVLSYVIFVGNNGPDAAIGVVLVDTLPASFTFISATPQKGTCTAAGNVVSCSLLEMAKNDRGTVTIQVMPTQPGKFTITAHISSETFDPNQDNNSASKRTRVIP